MKIESFQRIESDYVIWANFSGVNDWDQKDENGHTFQQNINRNRRKWDAANSKEMKEIYILEKIKLQPCWF